MATANELLLRQRLGESYPEDGGEEDTFFLDVEITGLLARNNGGISAAAAEGWRIKAADFAGLMDVADGGSSRKLSQLFRHARQMSEYYESVVIAEEEGMDIPAGAGSAASINLGRRQPGLAPTPPPTPESYVYTGLEEVNEAVIGLVRLRRTLGPSEQY